MAATRTASIVQGSHLDSVVPGPGINDNGSGSAYNLESAIQVVKNHIKTKNKIRFAWWGAEEFNLLGSQFYVDSLSDEEFAKILANLNFDMIASPNFVRFVYDGDGSDTGTAGPAGSGEIEQIFVDWFDSQGLATEPTAFDGRSDYGPFIDRGAPAGGLFTGAEGVKTAAAGGRVRRRRRRGVRPLLPPGLRHDQQPERHRVRPDGRRRRDGADGAGRQQGAEQAKPVPHATAKALAKRSVHAGPLAQR